MNYILLQIFGEFNTVNACEDPGSAVLVQSNCLIMSSGPIKLFDYEFWSDQID